MGSWLRYLILLALFVAACGKVADSSAPVDPGSPDSGAPVASDLGKTCASSSECATDNCIPVGGGSGGVCTETCTASSDCGVGGWSCVPRPGAASLCECTAAATGKCNGKDDDCNGKVDDTPEDSACDDGLSCEAGACVCKGAMCDGLCIDTAADPKNCGACGAKCNGVCAAGACTCVTGGPSCPPGDGRSCALDQRCHVTTALTSGYGDTVLEIRTGKTTVSFIYDEQTLSANTRYVSQISKSDGTRRPDRGFSEFMQIAPPLFGVDPESDDLVVARTDPATGIKQILYCPDGTCTTTSPLLSNQPTSALTIRGDYVHWVDGPTGSLLRCAKAGCANEPEVVAPAPGGVTSGTNSWLVSDAASLFVIFGNGLVGSAPLGVGGVVTTLATSAGAYGPSLDDDTLYFAASAGALACAKSGCAGAPRTIAAGALSVMSDNTRVYWSLGIPGGSDTIESAPKAGGAVVPLLTVLTPGDKLGGFPMALDASYLYFGSSAGLSRIDR